MIVEATIQQLRDYCPPLAGRVAGAADFQQGLKNYNTNMVLPSGYVVPLDQESDGNRNMVGVFQIVRKTFGVIVEFDATPDRRGQTPVMDYDAIEKALLAALLNWPPAVCVSPNGQGYFLTGGRFLDLDRARLFYQWEFTLNYQLDDTDGWQPESVPLEAIELDIFHAPVAPGDLPPIVIQIPIGDGPYPPPTNGPWPGVAAQTTWDNNQSIWDNGQSGWDVVA